MTACPFCPERGDRQLVHAHMVTAHPDRLEVWSDAADGRMRYRVVCPHCDDLYEHRIKPRSRDPEFLEKFAVEIRMVAFDMLLNHVQGAHEAQAEAAAPAASEPLPLRGAGGGRGRPGTPGIPLPPGMEPSSTSPIPGFTPAPPPSKGDR